MQVERAIDGRQASGAALGILCIFAGAAAMSGLDAIGKFLVERYPVMQVLGIRAALAVAFLVPMIMYQGGLKVLRTDRPWVHLVRASAGMAAFLCFFFAVRVMNLADAVTVAFAAPLFMTALAVPILGEKVGIRRWSATIVGFLGVMLVVEPTGGLAPGALLAIGAAVFYALAQVVTRSLGRTESMLSLVAYMSIMQLIVAGAVTPFVWVPVDPAHIWLLVMMAVLGLGAHYLTAVAYSRVAVAILAPFEYTALLWAVLLGYLVFQEIPAGNVWLGAAIIAGAGLYTAYRERARRAG
ncbi:DMT family transporter [Oceanibacterium hippocampi]|uniref:Riboflavin transporter n=1 Tax=Oceanibacterium hippocampi TaxID=745714 RepID=A0A1Y5U390_9PROT|nr:DMT family transporter [Oceanibacterium hippocampi]SLN77714.1 Riboflavin transporter [Oceanibacterium hippocampi]